MRLRWVDHIQVDEHSSDPSASRPYLELRLSLELAYRHSCFDWMQVERNLQLARSTNFWFPCLDCKSNFGCRSLEMGHWWPNLRSSSWHPWLRHSYSPNHYSCRNTLVVVAVRHYWVESERVDRVAALDRVDLDTVDSDIVDWNRVGLGTVDWNIVRSVELERHY